MSRGYPDFFGFSIFPFYGQMYKDTIALVGPIVGVETDITELVGKGIVVGGWLYLYETVAGAVPTFYVYVDGQVAFGNNMAGLLSSGFIVGSEQHVIAGSIREDVSYGVVHFQKEIPFGYQFKITGKDTAALGASFAGSLFYYKIQ